MIVWLRVIMLRSEKGLILETAIACIEGTSGNSKFSFVHIKFKRSLRLPGGEVA